MCDALTEHIATLTTEFLPFGPAEADITLAQDFGAYHAEYAAIRQRVGIMHLPQRGLLDLRGSDVKDFLHRMITQEINKQTGGASVRAFQLNEKGRIVADMIVHHGDANTWLEMDVFDIAALRQLLEVKLFTEDVAIEDITGQRSIIALYGPAATQLLGAVADDGVIEPSPGKSPGNMPGTHHVLKLAGQHVTVSRDDSTGALGLRLYVPADHAVALYDKLLEAAGYDPDAEVDADWAEQRRAGLRGRPIGWLAYNTARIEAGSPLFHIDFGHDSLPAETALLDATVSFTKGCYQGQEIVARMHNLGHPKRVLTGIKLPDDRMPVAGSQILEPPAEGESDTSGKAIGAVTSSTISPLLGNTAIGFAVMKWGKHQPGIDIAVPAEGQIVAAKTHALRFLQV